MLPTLYSFRRCPYAIRTRLALHYAEQSVDLHEVSLRDKPAEMLAISPKATVPVLQLPDGTVLEESLDIMLWALGLNDPQQLLPVGSELDEALALITENDGEFKHWLDHYKYAVRHPEQSPEYYRQHGEVFLQKLEARLTENTYLSGSKITLSDIAIVPFVRQFAFVDKHWFDAAQYPALQRWLAVWLTSEVFLAVMAKAKN
uniref:Glutathione S-transferase n=1 Tax=uncultured Thiotrichaceae bacterium TaxID=298394 RepID=A0A6S6SF99_9GAMM|nr:MAG: Glutathione S-transferase [uncultured Thiotrichaceae bacterium]